MESTPIGRVGQNFQSEPKVGLNQRKSQHFHLETLLIQINSQLLQQRSNVIVQVTDLWGLEQQMPTVL